MKGGGLPFPLGVAEPRSFRFCEPMLVRGRAVSTQRGAAHRTTSQGQKPPQLQLQHFGFMGFLGWEQTPRLPGYMGGMKDVSEYEFTFWGPFNPILGFLPPSTSIPAFCRS